MKSRIIISAVLVGIVVLAGITYSFIHKNDNPVDKDSTATAKSDELSKVVHVEDLAQNPENFKGEIVLRGMIVGVKKSEGVFGIVGDECQAEGTICPDDVILPVRFSGNPPEPKTIVEITGRVLRGEKGLIIDAKRVEIIK